MRLEFCSKWFFQIDDTIYVTRNLNKILTQKQYYMKHNKDIVTNPSLHA